MKVTGDYHSNGYALIEQLLPREVAHAFMSELRELVGNRSIPLSGVQDYPNLLARPAFEVYGYQFRPLLYILWGLTPAVSELVGRDLLPTYDYLRLYRKGDVCRVHHDRYSCEHSLSLTLDYSDDKVWNLEVERERRDPSAKVEESFGGEGYASLPMAIGDAVLYQGVHHRHGRITANPNRWSAHLFLHWVDRDGPYRDHAFDQRGTPRRVDFTFS